MCFGDISVDLVFIFCNGSLIPKTTLKVPWREAWLITSGDGGGRAVLLLFLEGYWQRPWSLNSAGTWGTKLQSLHVSSDKERVVSLGDARTRTSGNARPAGSLKLFVLLSDSWFHLSREFFRVALSTSLPQLLSYVIFILTAARPRALL